MTVTDGLHESDGKSDHPEDGPVRQDTAYDFLLRPPTNLVQLAQPGFIRDGTWGVSVRRIESEEPSTRRKSGHDPAPFGTTRHYVAQDQPLHVVVGGLCPLFRRGVHSWV